LWVLSDVRLSGNTHVSYRFCSGFEVPTHLENFAHRLREKLEERHINSQTCLTQWRGEKMDQALAVEHIWRIDHPEQFQIVDEI